MKVLHLADRAWPVTSGSQVYLQEISERLVREGHSVQVVTTDAEDLAYFWDPRASRVSRPHEIHNGVAITRIPVRHLPLSGLAFPLVRRLNLLLGKLPGVPLTTLYALAQLTPWVPDLGRVLDSPDERPDLVHAMNLTLDSISLAACEYARRLGLPLVYTPFLHLGREAFYTMRHQLALLAAADAVIVQTALEKQALVRRGLAADRIHIVGLGVNPAAVEGGDGARFRSRHHLAGPVVLFLGANARDKGLWQTVEAMEQLSARGLVATLVVAGPPAEAFTRWLAGRAAGTGEHVRVLGLIPEQDKRDALAACDVLALPSRVESYGIVYLEAWLYNKPVIGARAGAVPEVIAEGEDGLLVPFGDPMALADALHSLLSDPVQAHRLGISGRARVLSERTWDRKYALLRPLFERLAGRGPGR